jgi:hypothetical protein
MKKLLLFALVMATQQTYPMFDQIRQAVAEQLKQYAQGSTAPEASTAEDTSYSKLGQVFAEQLKKYAPEGSALAQVGQQVLDQFKNLAPAKIEQFKELHAQIKTALNQVDQILNKTDTPIASEQISGLLNALNSFGHGLFGLPRLTGIAQEIYANTNVKEVYKKLVEASPDILPLPSTSSIAPKQATIKDQFANSFIRELALKLLSHNLNISDKAGFEKLKPILTPEHENVLIID